MISVSLTNTHLSIINVVMPAESQYLPFILTQLPETVDGLILSVLESYLVGVTPVKLEVLTAVNSNIVIYSSSLVVTPSAYFPAHELYALGFYDTVLANTTVTITATDVVGVPSGVKSGNTCRCIIVP